MDIVKIELGMEILCMGKKVVFKSDAIIADLLNHILNCMQINEIYAYGYGKELMGLYHDIKILEMKDMPEQCNGFIYLKYTDYSGLESIIPWVQEHRQETNMLIYIEEEVQEDVKGKIGHEIPLKYISQQMGSIFLLGPTFDGPSCDISVPDDFRIMAVIHTYNEADVIDQVVEYLIGQGVDVYLLDNWSTDGTYEKELQLKEAYLGKVRVERFPESGKTENYEWHMQLEKTEQISKELDYDWYIHNDADEMRVSPWENITLRQAIYYVNLLGYNLMDLFYIDFKITERTQKNIFMKDTYFEFGKRPLHYSTKIWKKSEYIDLKKSGGHQAVINNPKVFPLLILNRHYPFRTVEQAERKVFRDRKPRFAKERKKYGWHGHYDVIKEQKDFIVDKDKLFLWNDETFYDYYIPLFCGCGVKIQRREEILVESQPLEEENRALVVYGAGKVGKQIYQRYAEKNRIVGWVDRKYNVMTWIFGRQIENPEEIKNMKFDYVLIGIENEEIAEEIKDSIIGLGVEEKKVIWTCPKFC